MLKCTFIFNLSRASMSESHYPTGASTFAALQNQAIGLANLRSQLLGAGAYLTQIRMTDLANPRDVQFVDPTAWTHGGPYVAAPPTTVAGEAQVDADQPNASLRLSISTTGVPKSLYLCGIPDDIIGTQYLDGTNLTANFNSQWVGLFRQWAGNDNPTVNSMCGGRWGCLVKAPSNPQNALAVAGLAPWTAFAAVQTTNPLNLVAGQKILVKGFRRINPRQPGISGVYKVLAVQTGNIYVLAGLPASAVANTVTLPGVAAELAYTVATYTHVAMRQGTSRKRGGSYGLPHGKSRTRV